MAVLQLYFQGANSADPAGKLSSPGRKDRKDGKSDPAAGRTRGESNAQHHLIATRYIARQKLEHQPISCFGGTFQTAPPPDPLYPHYVRDRQCLRLALVAEYI